MNFNQIKEDHLNILREIHKKKSLSQRQLAKETGVSLGKLNYCLKALKEKGLIKIKNFKQNPNKITYIYILTPKGIAAKTKLTINFMRQKMFEYDQLKLELERIRKN
jgi:EPS-associated MarR family transcriptional regulator